MQMVKLPDLWGEAWSDYRAPMRLCLFQPEIAGNVGAVMCLGACFGVPVVLSGVPLIGAGHWNTQYDVSADASRVYFMDRQEPRRPAAINVVLGWRALLR